MAFYSNIYLCSMFIIAFVSDFSKGAPPSKIIGGTNAAITTWPSTVALRINNQHFCGGTLITRCHVLTAAHCVYGMNMNSFTVATGSSDQMQFRNIYRIKRFNVHPQYRGESTMYLHDIAIITLQQCIVEDQTKRVSFIYPHYLTPNTVGTVVGWGKLAHQNPMTNRFLQQVQTRVMDNNECINAYHGGTIRPSQLCGLHSVGHGFCSGDSGGPLYVNNQVAGIVSMASGCGAGIPDIYTRLDPYFGWIQQNMQTF
ncbi:hypothetical protein PV328_004498 [Microctonus aethiopoides]|uniref:Peptidase S1 domain-containing protein n=2 Tax=Microctonus aethiopoides TaxID=144406 RepID=A0AA39FAM4_9HYME|nr:hypothetical protein PV328_004498 [Microctonus aethiopoides]